VAVVTVACALLVVVLLFQVKPDVIGDIV